MNDKIKVLMVDDEAQFRATTEKILNRRGFHTILAESGEEALEKLDERPDVVILDIKMPGMDGHQALREIKKRSADLPVIMLTGHGAEPSAKEALETGAFDYLSKPCDIDLLASKINEAYQSRQEDGPPEEKSVSGLMVPIEDFTTVTEDLTVADAIQKLKESMSEKVSTSRIMETKHRTVLVFDSRNQVQGMLTVSDLIDGIMPGYLSAPKPSTADSIQYSPMFWTGAFTKEVTGFSKKRVHEIMSPAPLSIDADANLMEAAYMMYNNKARRLVIVREGKVIGVIRELDLFFEMERVLRRLS